MQYFRKITIVTVSLSVTLSSFLFSPTALAAPELIKASGLDTVYYLDDTGVRHAFPNATTYQSWYGASFSKVVTFSQATMAQYPLGKNITIRPGIKIVKVPSAPAVYAVEQGGVLRQLPSEDIAAAIYGKNWANRVVDIPEVFFSDYTLGEPIARSTDRPNSTLYQDEKDQSYFYLNNDYLQPFASAAAVSANGFKPSDAISGPADAYAIRPRPISSRDKNIFNPIASSLADRRDCANTDLKTAWMFVAKDDYAQGEVEKVKLIQSNTPEYFNWATRGLSTLDANQPVSIMRDDGYLLKDRKDGTFEINNEALMTFYDNHPDVFDFIFVFTNFELPNSDQPGRLAYFVPVTNKQQGIGRVGTDRSNSFGSTGKLKGIIVMGNIANYTLDAQSGLDRALAVVAHEILHQWAAYVAYADGNHYGYDLLRPGDESHWSNYATFISPLGGSGWVTNGDGTFTSGLLSIDANKRQYSDLDLYLMGLLPKQVIQPITLLIPQDQNSVGNTIKATPKQITIDQIIRALGQRQCTIY